jgi:putative Holliday junction resolvase
VASNFKYSNSKVLNNAEQYLNISSKEGQTEYYIGVDYGARKVGLALADKETRIAHTLKEVDRRSFPSKLKELRGEFLLKKIILGANLTYKKNIQKVDLGLEEFKQDIQKELPEMEIIEQEEFFTTSLAQKNLVAAGKKKIAKQDNSEAARIILQSWLDKGR